MLKLSSKMRRSSQGFTLIELIVVIAVLAILAAIITPVLINQVQSAKTSADIANAKTVENGILRAVAKGDLQLPLVDSATTVAAIKTEIDPIPACQVTGNKLVVNKATGRVAPKAAVNAATEFEIVP